VSKAGFRFWLLAFLFLLGFHAPVSAAVEIAFYSRELGGNNFPHAFVALHGSVDSTGEQVDTSYGFTAHSVTPALLFGSVTGEVVVEGARQMARSTRQFALTLSDAQYLAVMAVVEAWRNRPQPSYNLNHRNCVHFVAELARTLGLRVEEVPRLMKRPRSFLLNVRSLNPQLAPVPESGISVGVLDRSAMKHIRRPERRGSGDGGFYDAGAVRWPRNIRTGG
jgi:hypothetical protein